MRTSSIFYLILAVSYCSCYSQSDKPYTCKITKEDLKRPASRMSEVFDEISYIPLETNKGVIIGAANQYHLIKMKDCFCIYHSRCGEEILLFEEDGQFRCKVGSIGKGPGEYSGLFSVFFDEYLQNILVLQGKVINRYNLQGKYITSVKVPSNKQIRGMAVVDEEHWMFSFFGSQDNEAIVGTILTNKRGEIIQKNDGFFSSSPGSGINHAGRNRIYHSGSEVYFCPFDYNNTYRYKGSSGWELELKIEDPFRKPSDKSYGAGRNELMAFKLENGLLLEVMLNEPMVIIEGATPESFKFLVDMRNGIKYLSTYIPEFKKEGFINDIDGGMPFYLNKIYGDGYAYELIDALKLIEYQDKNLLSHDGANHGEYMNLKELVDNTKVNDNPIIVVSHIK